MNVPRRQFLHLAAAVATLPALSQFASTLSYPTRAVHLLEGFGAGGAVDIVARLIGQSLSERLGQSFVIENRSGATGIIATEAVVRAAPDGLFWPATLIDRICQGRQFPRPGGNDGGALANIAGRSSSGRKLARLRGKCMVRHLRSKTHAGRSHRNTQQGSQPQHR